MIIIKDDLIGYTWGEHEHFCPIRKVLSTHFRLTFQNGDFDDLVCKQFGIEVVVMVPFLQKSFVFYTIDLIGQLN